MGANQGDRKGRPLPVPQTGRHTRAGHFASDWWQIETIVPQCIVGFIYWSICCHQVVNC